MGGYTRRCDFRGLSLRLSTLGAREPVPGYRHKMVLCSHFEYPICVCVPFSNMSLAPSTKQWIARNLQKLCAHRDPVQGLDLGLGKRAGARILAWVLEKKKRCVNISARRVPY